MSAGAVAEIANCTIVGCQIGLQVIRKWSDYGGGIAIAKNVIAWNSDSLSVYVDGVSSLAATYSDFEDFVPGEGNLIADPRFVDPASDDFHLLAFSPCIDAGTSDAPTPTADYEGDPRFDDPHVADSATGVITYVDMEIDERRDASVDVPALAGSAVRSVVRPYPNSAGRGVEIRLRLPAGIGDVVIYDVSGRHMRTLQRQSGSGRRVVTWDGRDHRGELVPPGVYVVRLSGSRSVASKTISVY